MLIDLYILVDVDDNEVVRIIIKMKILIFVWNENFVIEVYNGCIIGLIVFYDVVIFLDDFVVNCFILFEEIKEKMNDFWVCLKYIVFLWFFVMRSVWNYM